MTDNAFALAIALSGTDVYVAGSYMDDSKPNPCYWEGDTFHSLEDSAPSGGEMPMAEDAFVS